MITQEMKDCPSCYGNGRLKGRIGDEYVTCSQCGGTGRVPNITITGPIKTSEPTPEKPAYEHVNHPDHYGGKDSVYEVIKVLRAWGLNGNANLWNAVKYIARAGKKPGQSLIQDLKKAVWYLQNEIEWLESQESNEKCTE